ncbi:MAG: sugar transporter substrate-binding protein [Paenibacillus sp.]|nr:sugar transporter substrate-binding protein [Paenibacillus sp.]
MKRYITTGVLFLAVSSMTGCSLSTGKQTGAATSDTGAKEITILLQDGTAASVKNRIATFEKSAKLFEEANPGVKVTLEKLATPKGLRTAMQERLQDTKPVDLLFGPFDPVLNELGPYADLLPMFKADKMTTDDLYESMVEMATVKGKLIGIPMAPTPLAVFYNKEWFDKAGMPYPGKEWTWEQFMNQSIKLQAANQVAGKEIFGSIVPFDLQLFESLAQSSGQSVVSPDGSMVSGYLNSKPVTEAFAKLLHHMNTSKASKSVSSSTNPVLQELNTFNAGMGIATAPMFSFLESNAKTAGKFGIAGLPYMEKGTRVNALYFNVLSITANSKQKELAWKFMKDVILNGDSQFQKDWGKQELLSVKSALQKSGQHLIPGMDVLVGEMNYSIRPVVYRNAAFSKVQLVDKRLVAATTEAEVLAALSDIAEDVDKQLKDNK